MPPPLHILDTSALTDLAKGESLTRHRLLDAVKAERLMVLASHPLVWELPGTRSVNEALYLSMTDVLMRATGRRVLLGLPQRAQRELDLGGALPFPLFVDDEQWLDPPADAETIDTSAAEHQGHVAGLTFHEAERAEDARQGLEDVARQGARERNEPYDPSVIRRGMKEAFDRPSYVLDLVEHYARVALSEVSARRRIALPRDVDPRTYPSIWWRAAIHVARIRAVVVGRTVPGGRKSPGAIDLIHLTEAAAYADVFVASDGRLRKFAETVPGLRCAVVSCDAWAASL